MGKKLLFVCLSFFSLGLIGQNLEIRDSLGNNITGDTITFVEYVRYESGFPQTFSHKKFMRLFNSSTNPADSMIIKLTRIELQTVTNTEEYYCFGQSCLGGLKAGVMPVRTSSDTLHAKANSYIENANNPFTVYIKPDTVGSQGVSIFQYEFRDDVNRANVAEINVRWDVRNVTSLSESKLVNKISLGPNPAKVSTTISFAYPLTYANQSVQVFDLLGKMVKEVKLNRGVSTVKLNVEDLNSGIYFVNVLADGQKLNSKKLIVQ